jgi:hypothetical protein
LKSAEARMIPTTTSAFIFVVYPKSLPIYLLET